MTATQALLDMIDGGLSPEAITSVDVGIPPSYLKMINHGVEADNRASHLTSVQYHLALAACDSTRLYDVGHSPPSLADDIRAFMQKVSVSADQALLAYFPKAWPARVAVHTHDGTIERLVLDVLGDPQRPFNQRQIEDKFHRVLAPAAPDHADNLLTHCRSVLDTNQSSAALVSEIKRVSCKNAT